MSGRLVVREVEGEKVGRMGGRRPTTARGFGRMLSRARSSGALVAALGVVLLSGGVLLGAELQDQTRELDDRLTISADLVNTNVRTLSQAQRELLRLKALIATGAPLPSVDTQQQFVTQRATESALDQQLTTLGSTDLLQLARDARTTWEEKVRPLVLQAARTPVGSPEREAAAKRIDELELTYNLLVSQGEIYRRTQAAALDRASRGLLDQTGDLTRWVGLLVAAGIGSTAVAGVLAVRLNRQRAATVRRLSAANDELAFFGRVMAASETMLLAGGPDRRTVWVNDAFLTFTGFSAGDVLARPLTAVLPAAAADAEQVGSMTEAAEASRPWRGELECRRRDGSTWIAAIDLSPVHGEDGEVEGFFAVLTDVTERHEAERLLDRARRAAEQSAEEKSRFLATMSHEIRSPLNAVLGLCDLLLLTELDPEQRDYAETAHRSGSHLLALVNDVLDFSALESGRVRPDSLPFAPRALVEEVARMFAPQADLAGLTLLTAVDAAVPAQVRGDEMRLRQVLVNLVGNALKFTEQGSVEVRLSATGGGGAGDGLRLHGEVRDTGIGMPSWRVPHLFRSFVRGDASSTSERGGTGLGLAICRRLVEAMGGTITLESEVDRGTLVRFDVAVSAVVAPVRAATAEGAPGLGPDLRVLVAEDDPVNTKVVVRMLGRIGVTPEVVADGAAAVARITEAADPADAADTADGTPAPIEVILMDVEMPVIDGLQATGQIRARTDLPQPWIIALTANALPGDRERMLAAGMDDYLSKPITVDALAAALARVPVSTAPTTSD